MCTYLTYRTLYESGLTHLQSSCQREAVDDEVFLDVLNNSAYYKVIGMTEKEQQVAMSWYIHLRELSKTMSTNPGRIVWMDDKQLISLDTYAPLTTSRMETEQYNEFVAGKIEEESYHYYDMEYLSLEKYRKHSSY